MFGRFFKTRNYDDIAPDEIFLDSSNLPKFDVSQFEGRIVKSISRTSIYLLGCLFVAVIGVFLWQVGVLQIQKGAIYAAQSENNRLSHTHLFSGRGIISDRNSILLAWNVPSEQHDFALRSYIATSGFAHVLGYVKYPQADSSGVYYETKYLGDAGVEKTYNNILNGKNGLKIVETDALMNIQSESVIELPKNGEDITLTIDARVQAKLSELTQDLSSEKGFTGGAGILMDINTGGIIALVSYPEYDPNILVGGSNDEVIVGYSTDKGEPYFNRGVSGQYTPGSIVKPFVAIGALSEGVVTPEKKILSTGSISIPNRWNPELGTVFKDWKAHGWVDIKDALAMSSNVYFYEVGGGFEDQRGIGIKNIEKYMRMFGIGEFSGIDIPGEEDGTIPNPKWKEENFEGEPWRIGDTYHTAIGQYGFQVTPVQMVRAVAAIASGGVLVTPHVETQKSEIKKITGIDEQYFNVVKAGMRQAVTAGTAAGLNVPQVKIAAKTGTAEIGISKSKVNSWIIGFFPYDDPKYAFVVMMEKGPRENTIGALFVMRQLLDWLPIGAPEYL
jgi:penicillin-binding protein 2